jgi:hypothetical protein
MGSTAEHPQTQIVSLPYSSSFPYTGTYCIKQHSELLPQKEKKLKRMKKRNEQNGYESNIFFFKKTSHLVARSKKQLPELHAFLIT